MIPWFAWLYIIFVAVFWFVAIVDDVKEGKPLHYVAAQVVQLAVIVLLSLSVWLPGLAASISRSAWFFLALLFGLMVFHTVEGFRDVIPEEPDLTPREGVILGILTTAFYALLLVLPFWGGIRILMGIYLKE